MMFPGQIPNKSEIAIKLEDIVGESRARTMMPNFLERIDHIYVPSVFPDGSPFISRSITFDATQRQEQRNWFEEKGLEYQPQQNQMDEYYHYITQYANIPQPTQENILARITHPSVQYSQVTQWLVNVYKDQYGSTKTKILLKKAATPWVTTPGKTWYPEKYWHDIYQVSSYQGLGNTATFSRMLERAFSYSTENFLLGHNAKATKTFDFKYGKTPAYKVALGVELELDSLTAKAIPILKELLGKHAIFKRDGSVSNGVEICTAPASLDIHKEVFKSFFENHEKTGLQANNNCGLHVHVDRAKLKQTQIAKILMFMNHRENNDLIENIAGRRANSYCQREDHTWDSTVHKTSGTKYTRVNLAPEATIEFRLFASTLDGNQFNRCLEFVQAVVDYTTPCAQSCSVKEITKKEHFISYTDKHKQFYPTLHAFLHPELKAKVRPTTSTGVSI